MGIYAKKYLYLLFTAIEPYIKHKKRCKEKQIILDELEKEKFERLKAQSALKKEILEREKEKLELLEEIKILKQKPPAPTTNSMVMPWLCHGYG